MPASCSRSGHVSGLPRISTPTSPITVSTCIMKIFVKLLLNLISYFILNRRLPLAEGLQVQADLPAGHPVWPEEVLEVDGSSGKDGATLARADRKERISVGQWVAQRPSLPARLGQQVPRAGLLLQGSVYSPSWQGGEHDRAGRCEA